MRVDLRAAVKCINHPGPVHRAGPRRTGQSKETASLDQLRADYVAKFNQNLP